MVGFIKSCVFCTVIHENYPQTYITFNNYWSIKGNE
jgi:hypothetical protein